MKRLNSVKFSAAMEVCALITSGIATGICFWPGNYGWMFWFVFVPLFWIILKKDWKAAFFKGWLFGIFAWLSGIYWFIPPLLKFLGIHFAAALPLLLVFFAWHGLMFAILAGAASALSDYFLKRMGWRKEITVLWVAAPAMAAVERFFPMLFPVYFANTQYFHLPQVQILEVFGPAGLLWLILGFNAAAYLLAKALWERKFEPIPGAPRGLYSALAIFGAFCGLISLNEYYGALRIRQIDALVKTETARGHSISVSIIQGSGKVEDAETLGVYRRLTAEALKTTDTDMVIWPESVYDRTAEYGISRDSSGEKSVFSSDFARTLKAEVPYKTTMLMGAKGRFTDKSGRPQPQSALKRNIAFITGPGRELLGLTEKRYLFPFGEFIPLGAIFPRLYRIFPYSDDISPGAISAPLNFAKGKAGVVICYEDLYTEASRRFSSKGANILFNITNEARFGYTMSPEQHLNLSALRAIENRRFFVRAVNTGISAVIDPAGRVVRRLAVKERGSITTKIQLMEYRTFYSTHGDFLCFFGILLVSFFVFLAMIKSPGDTRLL